jgi:hypothetical protein
VGVFLVGAMPWVQLFRDGERTAWVSAVRIDWSPQGTGRFVNLLADGRWRVVGTNEKLLDWLADWYLRPAMTAAGVGWQQEPFRTGPVDIDIDLDTGLRASGGGVEIELTEPIDRQLIRREPYPLGDFQPTASWVRVSCARARVVVNGRKLPGEPQRGEDSYGPRSTAQINIAEVWTT